jgi:hypothetical protein
MDFSDKSDLAMRLTPNPRGPERLLSSAPAMAPIARRGTSAALFVDGAMLSRELWLRARQIDLRGLVSWAETVAGPIETRYWFDATSDCAPNGFHHAAARAGGFRLKVHPQAPRTLRSIDGRAMQAVKQVGVDVGLAVSAVLSHERDLWETLVLVAGDGDFYPLAEYLVEQRSVRLIVLGVPEMSSPWLTSYASLKCDLSTVIDVVSRPRD